LKSGCLAVTGGEAEDLTVFFIGNAPWHYDPALTPIG
jgi:hypothetical protein